MSDFVERISRLPAERLVLLAAELKDRLDRIEPLLNRRSEPIAIVGMGCRFPGPGSDPEGYWRLLRDGVDAVREAPAERWDLDRMYDPDPDHPGTMGTRWGGFFDEVDRFDPRFFGIAPREAVSIDPQQRLLLEVTWEALENAGIPGDRMDGVDAGVFIGLCNHDYHELLLEQPLEQIDSYFASGTAGSMAAGRIAYLLGLHGPALTIDTACSSSLVALHLACESLRSGESQLAISGGANLILGVETMVGLTRAHMISPTGRCRAFDGEADGIVRGEGCGVVVLKRLSDARRDGDRVLALIRSSAVNQDGRSSGITAPNGPAQEALMRTALRRAGLEAADVDLIEAHGTGTRLGDPIEVRALGEVYGRRDPGSPLRIGSVKTNMGHLEAAAGIAGILKVVLALGEREIPPHLHLAQRNPLIEWDRWPIDIPTESTPWTPHSRDGIRRAAVSSFGFSGTNAHVILEEAPGDNRPVGHPEARGARPLHVLPLSARSPAALGALAESYADALTPKGVEAPPVEAMAATDPTGGDAFADFCHTAAVGRARFPARLAVVATDAREAAARLRGWAAGDRQPTVHEGHSGRSTEPAFLFTGQGAQWSGMGRDLFDTAPVFRETIERCDALFRPHLNVPLIDVLYPSTGSGAADDGGLHRTAFTQPALFSIELALAELWRSWGIEPSAVVGHSVGEFAAAVVAGVLSVEDAASLVAARGRLMGSLPAGGGMAAVLAPQDAVEAVLSRHPEVVVAGMNAPENTVISGPAGAVAAALREFGEEGVETRDLKVSHAFHSSLMDPVLDELEAVAAAVRFAVPQLPFASTLTGDLVDPETLGRPSYWRDQARHPVRFSDALRSLAASGHDLFLEVGPHPTLSGLGQAALPDEAFTFLPSLRRGKDGWPELLGSVAALFTRGAEVDWAAFDAPWSRRRAVLPTYPFERSRYWQGWSPRAHGAPGRSAASPAGRTADDRLEGLLWAREWTPTGGTDAAAFLPGPNSVAERIGSRVDTLVEEHGAGVYTTYLPRLDALCTAFIVQALRSLGLPLSPGDLLEDDALVHRLGIRPSHRRLVGRMSEILAEDGWLESTKGGWRVTQRASATAEDPDTLLSKLLRDFPECGAETQVTGRCGAQLAEVLTGEADPMELLFPSGSLAETEKLYGETPSFRVFNTLVSEAIALTQEGLPADRTLRILEIGAGTGGTSSRVLPLLDPDRTSYVFTDVSPLFLERARERFSRFDFVDYQLLDVGRDPTAQGFQEGTYDVVVASNVLHATPDLRRSLAHARRLLAPGGLLVLVEGVRPQRFGDLTVGMTPGWWSFTDAELRPDYVLVPAEVWEGILEEVGFEGTAVVPGEGGDAYGVLGQQAVFLTRVPMDQSVGGALSKHAGVPAQYAGVPASGSPDPGCWLARVREDGASGAAAEALRARGVPLLTVAENVGASSEGDQGASWDSDLTATPPDVEVFGLLHLLSLDEDGSGEEADAPEVLAAQERSTGSALLATQAAARAEPPLPVVFVTRSAEPAGGGTVAPTGSPLWGLGRAVAMEHPEVGARRLDLPEPESEESLDLLARILRENTLHREPEVAIRGGALLVPRIRRVQLDPTGPEPHFQESGSYLVTGGLSGLGLEVAQWMAQRGAGELTLNGRSAPSPEAMVVLDRIRSAGAVVRVVLGDVASPSFVEELVEATGPERLRGVFHCAGVTSDAGLLGQDWEHFQRVMGAKVAGSWNLHRATRSLSLDHFVLFSTAAAFLGSAGQSNHAAANAYLGALSHLRTARGLPGLAIDWGAWTEVGAATKGDVLDRARGAGLGAIDPATGLELLGRLLGSKLTHVAALSVDWEQFLARHPAVADQALFDEVRAPGRSVSVPDPAGVTATRDGQGGLASAVREAIPGNRRSVLLDGLHAEAAAVLGLAAGEEIDPSTPLSELGLDSLMAVELRNAIGRQLDLTLPATLLFNCPTLAEVAHFVEGRILPGEGTTAVGAEPTRGGPEEEEEEDTRFEDMSEEEMAALLERKLGLSDTL